MKVLSVAALAIVFDVVDSCAQTSTLDYCSLNEKVLLRRTAPKSHLTRPPSPSRSSPSSPDRGSRSSIAILQSIPIDSFKPNAVGPAIERTNSHAPPPSRESGSSSNGGRSVPKARVRRRITGPAVIRYESDDHEPRMGILAAGRTRRFTVRGSQRAAMDVEIQHRNPPGAVDMTVRGRQRAEVLVDSHGGGSGDIRHLAPVLRTPETVAAGTTEIEFSQTENGLPEKRKLGVKLEGSRRVRGEAFNRGV